MKTFHGASRAPGGWRIAAAVVVAFTGSWLAPATGWAQNPFAIDGVVPDCGPGCLALQFGDPSGGSKELGPLNGTSTKLGVIHTALPPMLGFTNPNGATDLVNIWLQTATDPLGELWLYFAWERDAHNGSSVITYEFQQAALATGCDYDGIDQVLPQDPGESALLAGCNPWASRAAGDFLVVWDFQGGATDIILRTFGGAGFDAGVNVSALGSAIAALNADRSAGEAAINLSDTVFPPVPTECLSIGNIIPGTITGNSDQADYKDTVLADFTDFITISNCGTVIIRKATEPAGAAGPFDFVTNLALLPPALVSGFTLDGDGHVVLYDNVQAPGSYSVTEQDAAALGFDLMDIDCSASSEPSEVTEMLDARKVVFNLGASQIVDCTFTNTLQKGAIKISKTRKFASGGPGPQPHPGVQFTVSGGSLAAPVQVITDASGEACLDGLVISSLVGLYTVTESVPPGYDADGAVSKMVAVSAVTPCGNGLENTVAFGNTPLTDVQISVAAQDAGATRSSITCVDADTGEAVGSVALDDPVALMLMNQTPRTIVCTIVIDP